MSVRITSGVALGFLGLGGLRVGFSSGWFEGPAAQPGMAAVSAREGANGGGSVRDDGLAALYRDVGRN